jgi:hypothetical protein
LMYEAKQERANHIHLECLQVENGGLIPLTGC